ncbi:unnamed protein product [Caenorhabditis angaria]|uniref:Uncharacterized protein n=1 Tax=Caenorhabditis angaria TaxID=860376 RepID=A0A9P1IWR1_9PELO|nr:unnamed protein product [Caenorhabditis angaria]
MKKKNFFTIQTLCLALLVFKLCFYYTVIQEQVSSLIRNDHPMIYSTNDVYLFDLCYTTVTCISCLCTMVLVALIALKNLTFRKSFLIFSLAFKLCFVLPVNLSGLYIAFESNELTTSDRIQNEFQNGNSSVLANTIRSTFCCCDLQSVVFVNRTEINNENSTYFEDNPDVCILKKCPKKDYFSPCDEKIFSMFRRKTLIFSIIGVVCSLIFIIVAPLLYSRYEKDRRVARSLYIREWRSKLGRRINGKLNVIEETTPLLSSSSKHKKVTASPSTADSTKSKNEDSKK